MGLKKYDKEAEQKELEVKEEETQEEKNKFNEIVEANEKEAEELNAIPLDEKQKNIRVAVENARKEYLSESKKQKRINTIISIAVIAVLVACLAIMITLGKNNQVWSYVSIGLMVLALLATFLTTKFIKKSLGEKAEKYINFLFTQIDDYLYNNDKFSEQGFKPNAQMKDELFTEARFYKNIKGTRSRNLISVAYNDKALSIADLAGNVLVKNRLSPMFLGKYFDYENSYSPDDPNKRILMQIKGGELSRPVDDVDDLKLVEGNDTYVIYTNDDNYKKVLTSKVISDICRLKVDKTLIDVIVSIRPGKTNIGIDYVDDFMNIPVESEFDFNKIKRSEQDLNKVLKIFEDLN